MRAQARDGELSGAVPVQIRRCDAVRRAASRVGLWGAERAIALVDEHGNVVVDVIGTSEFEGAVAVQIHRYHGVRRPSRAVLDRRSEGAVCPDSRTRRRWR